MYPIFTAALLKVAKIRKCPKCPSTNKWTKKILIHTHSGMLLSIKKMKSFFYMLTTHLEDIIRSEISQGRKTNTV